MSVPESRVREIVAEELAKRRRITRGGVELPDDDWTVEERTRKSTRPNRTPERVEIVRSPDGRHIIETVLKRSVPVSLPVRKRGR